MSFAEDDKPKKTDDEDDDDDEEEEDEEEDEDEDDDEEEFVTCTKCERSYELNATIRQYMARGRMTEGRFTCHICLAEKEAEREEKRAKKEKGAT